MRATAFGAVRIEMVEYDYNITESTVFVDEVAVCVSCGLESEVLVVDDWSPLEDSRCLDCWSLLRQDDEPRLVDETVRFLQAAGVL